MGKLELNKKRKKSALYNTAFELFTTKGLAKTTISDIVENAGVAKGTFYLYFKNKYEIRDILIVKKTRKLFKDALTALRKNYIESLSDQVIFIVNYVIDELEKNQTLLKFISKNLSWGVFQKALLLENNEDGDSFYQRYYLLLDQSGRMFRNPDLMLYMIVEFVNSTCHSVILQQQPVTLEELKPELAGVICDIIHRQEIR